MKKILSFLLIVSLASGTTLYGQNTFPATGNAGAKTTTPISELQVAGTLTIGIGASATTKGVLQVVPGISTNTYNHRLLIATDATGGAKFNFSKNITGTITDLFTIQDNGNVGIGIATPAQKFHVAGPARFDSTLFLGANGTSSISFLMNRATTDPKFNGFKAYNSSGWTFWHSVHAAIQINNTGYFDINKAANNADGTVSTQLFRISATTGNVGINNASPSEKLEVGGNIKFAYPGHLVSSQGFASFGDLLSSADAYVGSNVKSSPSSGLVKTTAALGSMITLQETDGIRFHVNLAGAIGGAIARNAGEAMRITQAGNVGIGTTAPTAKLEITGATGTSGLKFTNLNSSSATIAGVTKALGVDASGNVGTITVAGGSSSSLIDSTNNNSYWNRNGNLGIGTKVPAYKLDIAGQTRIGPSGVTYSLFDNNGIDIKWNQGNNPNDSRLTLLANVNTLAISPGGSIPVVPVGTIGNTNSAGIRLNDNNTSTFAYIGTQNKAILLNAHGDGNVGIGTTTPTKNLTIKNNFVTLRLESANDSLNYKTEITNNYNAAEKFFLKNGTQKTLGNKQIFGGLPYSYLNDYYGLAFMTSSLNPDSTKIRMVINQSGNVGIGTKTPTSARLEVNSNTLNAAIFKSIGQGGTQININNDLNKGIKNIIYDSNYAAGSVFSVGANGTSIFSDSNGPLAIGTYGNNQPLILASNNYERMRVTDIGVGIGITVPTNKLEISGGTASGLRLTNFKTPFAPIASNGKALSIDQTTGDVILTNASSATVADTSWKASGINTILTRNGNVGIGTSAPSHKLHISGPMRLDSTLFLGANGRSSISFTNNRLTTDLNFAGFTTNNGTGLSIWKGFYNAIQVNNAGYFDINKATNGADGTPATRLFRMDGNTGNATYLYNVGIGTYTPQRQFHISQTDNPEFWMESRDYASTIGSVWRFINRQGNFNIEGMKGDYSTVNQPFTIAANSGNIGLGIFSPAVKLDISGVNSSNPSIRLRRSTAVAEWIQLTSANGGNNGSLVENNQYSFDVVSPDQTLARPLFFRRSIDGGSTFLNMMSIDGNGNVGIGTTTPFSKIHSVGNLTIGNQATVTTPGMLQITSGGASPISNRIIYGSDNTGWKFAISKNSISGGIIDQFVVQDNGNIGIGITAPTEKLEVSGNIKTTGSIKVGAYTLPNTDGSSGQVLQTNGTGTLAWNTPSGGFALPSLTSGSLLFSNGTSIAQNNANLFWDNVNSRLGIGTKIPSGKIESVFITTPSSIAISKISDYVDAFYMTRNSNLGKQAIILRGNDGLGVSIESGRENETTNWGTYFSFRTRNTATIGNTNDLTERLRIMADGNIGIGISSPSEKLQVAGNAKIDGNITSSGTVQIGTITTFPAGFKLAIAGNMIAEQVKVKKSVSGAWPDFVFANEYKLPTLNSIEQYVNENKHLPEIPSAREVEKDGQDLGEMNRLLLKKVEELTLYMIEQNKKLENQQKEINVLKEKMK
jgi:hypothetical protein